MPQISSPSRRVLGEKDKNASLDIANSHGVGKIPRTSYDVRAPKPSSKALSEGTRPLPQSQQYGPKRRIDEVEDVEGQVRKDGPRLSQPDTISDSTSDREAVTTSMLSTSASRSMADTHMTSFYASQEGPNSLEQHFEMPQDEMSQRTLEKIHAVPLPQNTSQSLNLGTRPVLRPSGSQDSVGMSNFIDFGGSDSSQRSDGLEMIEEKNELPKIASQHENLVETIEKSPTEHEPTDDDRRRAMLELAAAKLRTRLQLAYFKVQTNQTTKPLSRLKVPESMRRSSSPPVVPSSGTAIALSALAAQEEMEARVSAFRARATAQAKPSIRPLNSLPIPSIKPTSYSARFTSDTISQDHPSTIQTSSEVIQIPSSPPISRNSAEVESNSHSDGQELPLPPKTSELVHTNIEQLSSPPASQDGNEEFDDDKTPTQRGMQKRRLSKSEEINQGMTDNVITSDAADGLLRLLRGST